MVEVCPVKLWHVEELIRTMRESDRREIWAAANRLPEQSLSLGLQYSPFHLETLMCDEGVIAIGGTAEHSNKNIPWMLGSDLMDKYFLQFARANRKRMEMVFKHYDRLENYVHSENSKSIDWLKWLGFTVHPAKPYGKEQELFHRFEYVRRWSGNRNWRKSNWRLAAVPCAS